MVRCAALLVLATGCRQLLGFEELADPGDAPIVDGSRADGRDPDAPSSDAPMGACPPSYTISIAGSMSRYRSVTNSSITWLSANTDCANDGINTHLIVLSSDGERSGVAAVTGSLVKWIGLSNRAANNGYVPVTDEPTTYPPTTGAPWAVGDPVVNEIRCVALSGGELVTNSF